MKAETKRRETQAKAQLVPGPIATAGLVCAGGDYIWGFIFYLYLYLCAPIVINCNALNHLHEIT